MAGGWSGSGTVGSNIGTMEMTTITTLVSAAHRDRRNVGAEVAPHPAFLLGVHAEAGTRDDGPEGDREARAEIAHAENRSPGDHDDARRRQGPEEPAGERERRRPFLLGKQRTTHERVGEGRGHPDDDGDVRRESYEKDGRARMRKVEPPPEHGDEQGVAHYREEVEVPTRVVRKPEIEEVGQKGETGDERRECRLFRGHGALSLFC